MGTEVASSLLGPLAAFASSFTWAYGTAVYSRLSRGYSPATVNFSRSMIAFPLFLIGAFVASGSWGAGISEFAKLQPFHLTWFLVSMVSSYGLGDMFFYWSTRGLGVPGALAIASSYPVWTVLGGMITLGEVPSLRQGIGLVMVLAGVVAVILNGPQAEKQQGQSAQPSRLDSRVVGAFLALATSLCWGLNSFSIARASHGLSPFVGNSVRMAYAMVINLILARIMVRKANLRLPLPVGELRRNARVFVVEAFGGSLFFMYGLASSPLVLGTTLSSLAPVVSVPVAYVLGVEKPSWARTLGVLTVVLGLFFLVVVP